MLLLFNKNYLLTILLVLLVSVTTTECKEVKTDLQRKNLKGKVKSVRYIDYKAVDKFGELTKGDKSEYNWNNKLTKYDNNGNEIEWNRYNSDGSLDCKYTYKYDNNGNKIEENCYNSDGSLCWKYTYKYDNNGNTIEKNSYKSDGSLYRKYTYKYDNNGNKIEENGYKSDGSLDYKYTYKYDNNGNTIEGNRYNSDGSLDYKYTYKYKYDKYGNWIQKIYFEQKGEKSISLPQTITEQTIEYYK